LYFSFLKLKIKLVQNMPDGGMDFAEINIRDGEL